MSANSRSMNITYSLEISPRTEQIGLNHDEETEALSLK
jgi:hypothetical protein